MKRCGHGDSLHSTVTITRLIKLTYTYTYIATNLNNELKYSQQDFVVNSNFTFGDLIRKILEILASFLRGAAGILNECTELTRWPGGECRAGPGADTSEQSAALTRLETARRGQAAPRRAAPRLHANEHRDGDGILISVTTAPAPCREIQPNRTQIK